MDVRTDRYELSLPPKLTFGQIKGFTLDEASAACTAWRERPSAGTGEALAAALDHLNTVVEPHLDDEEQKVVPLAAVTLTQ